MADDPKPSHAVPPFAYKGAARPLARRDRNDGEAAGVREERRPSGLHTRPDLFGSSAVMPKPVDPPVEESDETEPPQSDDEALPPSAESQPEEDGEPSEAPPGAVTPAANLLDHPVRIPESISFEDWPDGPDSEPEDGARAPHIAMPEAAEPEPQAAAPEVSEPEPQAAAPEVSEPEPQAAAPEVSKPEPQEPQEPPRTEADQDQVTPTYAPPPAPEPPEPEPEEQTGRLAALLARLEADGIAGRLREQRWPLALGAVSCAALLLAALVGGVIPLTGDDREAAKIAQSLGAQTSGEALPASEDPVGPSESNPQDMPVAPAGNVFGTDRPLATSPDRSQAGSDAATSSVADSSSQLAALPDTRGPDPLGGDREPIVDFMRIDPDGKAVVAGRAAPGTELIVLDNGEPLGTITTDIYGLWTFVSQHPLADGRHEIGLRVKRKGSEISDPALVTESGSTVPLAPDSMAKAQDPLADAASSPDLPATEQLAAVEPETPVQSDQSPPRSVTEPSAPAAEDQAILNDPEGPAETAEAASAITGSGQPAPDPAQDEKAAEAPSAIAESAHATEPEAAEPAPAMAASAQPDEAPLAEANQPDADAPPPTATAVAPTPAPKPEPPEQTQTAALPTDGNFVIQFAAFKDPDTAAREQILIEQRFSDLLAGQEVFVQKADLGDQGTFYRLRLGPFASLADARTTCARFQERDRDCLAMAR